MEPIDDPDSTSGYLRYHDMRVRQRTLAQPAEHLTRDELALLCDLTRRIRSPENRNTISASVANKFDMMQLRLDRMLMRASMERSR